MAISDSPFLPSLAGRTSLTNDRDSILRYQRFHKLPATGVIDKRTAQYMRSNNTHPIAPPPRKPTGSYPASPIRNA